MRFMPAWVVIGSAVFLSLGCESNSGDQVQNRQQETFTVTYRVTGVNHARNSAPTEFPFFLAYTDPLTGSNMGPYDEWVPYTKTFYQVPSHSVLTLTANHNANWSAVTLTAQILVDGVVLEQDSTSSGPVTIGGITE